MTSLYISKRWHTSEIKWPPPEAAQTRPGVQHDVLQGCAKASEATSGCAGQQQFRVSDGTGRGCSMHVVSCHCVSALLALLALQSLIFGPAVSSPASSVSPPLGQSRSTQLLGCAPGSPPRVLPVLPLLSSHSTNPSRSTSIL